jgi:hypothetical protein
MKRVYSRHRLAAPRRFDDWLGVTTISLAAARRLGDRGRCWHDQRSQASASRCADAMEERISRLGWDKATGESL